LGSGPYTRCGTAPAPLAFRPIPPVISGLIGYCEALRHTTLLLFGCSPHKIWEANGDGQDGPGRAEIEQSSLLRRMGSCHRRELEKVLRKSRKILLASLAHIASTAYILTTTVLDLFCLQVQVTMMTSLGNAAKQRVLTTLAPSPNRRPVPVSSPIQLLCAC
jgi:hypothetical protein